MYLEIKSIEELQEATLICKADGLKWGPNVDWNEFIPTIEAELFYGPICLALSEDYIYWVTKEEVKSPASPSKGKGPIFPFQFIKNGLKSFLFKSDLFQLLEKHRAEIWCEVESGEKVMLAYLVNEHKCDHLTYGALIGVEELLKLS